MARVFPPPGVALAVLSADVSNNTTTVAAVGDLQFTPAPGGVYFVEVYGLFTAAAGTTGDQWRIDAGNAVSGGVELRSRGSASTNNAVQTGSIGTTLALGLSSDTGENIFWGFGIIQAHATAPTAIQVYFASEVGGSAVTLKAGKCFMRWTRIS